MAADWLLREVADGLQRLVALALPGQPPAETIALTASAWREALDAASIGWDERLDTPRVRAAFRALMRDAERWPAPVHLLRALPARREPVKLPKPQATDIETVRARIAEIASQLKVKA